MLIEKFVFTVAEAAALIGYSSGTVYRLIHRNAIMAYKDEGGRVWHIPSDSIVDYVAARMHKNAPMA